MRRQLEVDKTPRHRFPTLNREDYEDDIAYERAFKAAFEELNPGVPLLRGRPGARLTDIIDEFLVQGVTPDLLPADLGYDDATEVDARSGHFSVDPFGDIRTDPFTARELRISQGLDAAVDGMPAITSDPPAPAVE